MYNIIQMGDASPNNVITESSDTRLFTEAVFADGKKAVKPISDAITNVKERLLKMLDDAEKNKKEFNPTAFWKDNVWKVFEDSIQKVFGFRSINVHPYIEKYNTKTKEFESHELQAYVYRADRFPVEGLVTEKGFYDKSHSLTMDIFVSLGTIKEFSVDEILAVFLHEFGHSIDPALTTISYAETNILSKYLMDRKGTLSKAEQKLVNTRSTKKGFLIIPTISSILQNSADKTASFFRNIAIKASGLFGLNNPNKLLAKIKKELDSDKSDFNRKEFSEAFADNFARMYGYAAALASAFKKMELKRDEKIRNRYKREKDRQKYIMAITKDLIKDEHKTDIHRINALIKEYKEDIADPNIPETVKKQMKEDITTLENILKEYTTSFDDFQNRVNKLIIDELKNINGIVPDSEVKTEDVEFFDHFDVEPFTETPNTESMIEFFTLRQLFNDPGFKPGPDAVRYLAAYKNASGKISPMYFTSSRKTGTIKLAKDLATGETWTATKNPGKEFKVKIGWFEGLDGLTQADMKKLIELESRKPGTKYTAEEQAFLDKVHKFEYDLTKKIRTAKTTTISLGGPLPYKESSDILDEYIDSDDGESV